MRSSKVRSRRSGKSDAIHVILVGKEDVINQELSGYTYNVVGLKMVKDKEADAFVSAGSSGAVLAGETEKGFSILIDCGANVRCKTFTSGAVCQDGFDLYGTYYGSQELEIVKG